jgi:hypothetical protein
MEISKFPWYSSIKELWDVVDGTKKKPAADTPDTSAWQKKDEKALATIYLSVEDSGLVHERPCKKSAEAWKELEEVYETKTFAKRRTDA